MIFSLEVDKVKENMEKVFVVWCMAKCGSWLGLSRSVESSAKKRDSMEKE